MGDGLWEMGDGIGRFGSFFFWRWNFRFFWLKVIEISYDDA